MYFGVLGVVSQTKKVAHLVERSNNIVYLELYYKYISITILLGSRLEHY